MIDVKNHSLLASMNFNGWEIMQKYLLTQTTSFLFACFCFGLSVEPEVNFTAGDLHLSCLQIKGSALKIAE